MTDLVDSVESLRRAVATPGEFADTFPSTTEDDLVGVLADALAEAQLDRLIPTTPGTTMTVTEEGVVTPDLDRAQVGLVVLYAAYRFIRSVLVNRPNIVHYEARGAIYETQQNVTVLNEILKELSQQKKDVQQLIRLGGLSNAFYMGDQYLSRVWSSGYHHVGA